MRGDFKPTALLRETNAALPGQQEEQNKESKSPKKPQRDEPARWYEPSTSSFRFSSERTPAAASNTSRGAVVFKAPLFLLLRLLKNKDSSEGNSSDLKQIFVFTCWEPIHQRKKRKRERRSLLFFPLRWDVCVQPLKNDPLQTPGPLLNPSVALIVCVAVNIL